MTTNLDKFTAEELSLQLMHGQVDVNELNLAKSLHRSAFAAALKSHPRLLQKVSSANAQHFISYALELDYGYFACVKREQYTNQLVQLYLFKRLKAEELKRLSLHPNSNENIQKKSLQVQKSLDNKLIFQYNHLTPDEEELYYFDKELQVPLSLKSNFKIVLKLTKALTFIEKLDIEIAQLGENKIRSTIADLLSNQYREQLSNYIESKNIGYYTLASSISELEKGLTKSLNHVFDDYGFEVSSVIIKQIAIPKDIQYKLEDLAFNIRQKRADVDADIDLAKKSLENYEAKLSIEEKYPNANHSLTEYEKDLALKRYLIKNGKKSSTTLDHSINLKNKIDGVDAKISKSDVIPEIVPKKNNFKRNFFICLSLAIILSVILMIVGEVGVGFIILGVTSALFGTIAALSYNKFKEVSIENNIKETTTNGNNQPNA